METGFIYLLVAAVAIISIFKFLGKGSPGVGRRGPFQKIARQLGHRYYESFNLDQNGLTVLDKGKHENEAGFSALSGFNLFSSGQGAPSKLARTYDQVHETPAPKQGQLFAAEKTGQVYKNLIIGTSSRQRTLIFDYHYTLAGSKSSPRRETTVVVFESAGLELPRFLLRPEKMIHKLGELLGFQDIDFHDFPKFSKMYLLQGDDEFAVRLLFRPEIVSFLEKQPDFFVEAHMDKMILYSGMQLVKPEELLHFVERCRKFVTMFSA